MKQPRLFINLIVIIILAFVISGLSLTSSVESAQAAPAANIPSQQATVADLAITKTNGQASTVPGTATTYTIVVTNNGPDAVLAATVTDTFPAELTGVTWTCSNAGGGTCTNASGSGDINETIDLPVGTSVTFSATGTVSASATGSLVNTATVTASVNDPDPANNSDTDTDTLTPEANLAISKTNNQNSTVPGTATTYVIEVTNSTGPSNISGATVADTFPAALTGVTWTCAGTGGGTCPASGSGNINNTVNLPVGSSVTFTATGTVNPSATGSLANTATVALPGGASDPNTGNNTDTDTDTLTPQANLAISKTNNQTSTIPGTLTTYTIVVTNSGPSNAPGATVTDNFPGTLTGVAWTCAGTGGGTCTASGSGDIGDTVNLPPGGSVTFSASGTVNADATGSLANTASVSPPGGVTDPTPGNNSATDTDTLTPQANLAVTKTNNQTSTVPGTPTTYIITVTNSSGPSDITGATVSDIFPSMTGVTWNCSGSGGGACQGSSSGSNNISNKPVNLPVGSSVTFTATGTVDPGVTGSLINTATVALPDGSSDPIPGNNSATDTDTLTPQADLSISKTDGVVTLIPGNDTTYTIIVSNSGPSSATGATVTDTFPSMTGVTWTCTGTGGGTCPASGSGNINNTVNLPPGGSVTFSATGTVNPGARGTLVNTATVTVPAGVTELVPGNNSATDTDTLNPRADLQVNKTDAPDPVSAGSALNYTIAIHNIGPSDATGVTLSDNLDNSSVTFVSSTPAAPTCTLVGGDVGCNLGTVFSGSTITVTIQVLVNSSTPAGFISNQAHVESVEFDPSSGNNDASASTAVQVRSDLSITKTDSPDPAALGAPFTYSLRVTNNGPSNATGVTVQDVLPGGASGVNFVSANSTLGSCTGTTTVNCTLGNMVSGNVATVTIVVDPKATGIVNNTGTVASTSTDPTPGNDSSTATTTVNRVTDLVITNSDAPDPVTQGNNLTYTLGVINNGPSGATNVTVMSSLPAGVSFSSVTPGTPTCNEASGVITCNLGSIAKNGTATISVIVNVDSSTIGLISSTASVAVSGSTDPNSSNNSATATTLVNGIEKLYLPLLLKPPPTQLSVHNDNTGGNVTVTVQGTGVSCMVPNNTILACGSFPPGTYNVQVISPCGTATVPKFYDSGPQTTRVFCK